MEQEMQKRKVSKAKKGDEEKWVEDSSVDYKGKTPLRASTGVWKACLIIIIIEFSERLSYFGISINLISYLTKVINQDLKTAAKNVNYWGGVTTLSPLIGGFLADAYTGRFAMILLSSLIYFMGLSLLTLSQFIPSLRPCNRTKCDQPRKIHEVVFFIAIYCISLGTGGHKPCIQSFGADQFDDNHAEERKKKMSFFNWWSVAICVALFLGVIFIVYIEDNVSWGAAFLIVTIVMFASIVTFYMGKPLYRYRLPEGSPFTPMLQVLIAAIRKRKLTVPSDPALLYEIPLTRGRLLGHTLRFRFLDKAAILEENDQTSTNKMKYNPWRLATVTKVEEMKLVLNVIPIWLTSLIFGVCLSQTTTFFVKQGATMNRNIGHNFQIPPASVNALGGIGMIVSLITYEKILVPMLRKATGNERGISILKRIGIGLTFPILSMSVAALVERKRLRVAHEEMNMVQLAAGEHLDLPMSVFWLAPQYMIIGIGDGFALVGLQEYFYDQVPDSMRSLGIALYVSVIGVGNFLTNLILIIVDHATERNGKSWIGKDLNSSRLDNFYWLLAAMSVLNLWVYVFFAKRYTYKTVQEKVDMAVDVADCSKDDRV